MVYWVGLGRVVGEVQGAGCPLDFEVAFLNAILNPVIAHPDGFASLDLCGAICEVASGRVVVGDERGTLGMAKIGESLAVNSGVLSVHVEGGV